MMIKNNKWWWLLLPVSLLSFSGVQADSAPSQSASKTVASTSVKTTVKLDEKQVVHACARKSVPELSRKAKPFQRSIHTNSRKFRVDGDLIRAVITVESCYKTKALSSKSAQGLMQLIPATAERFGVSDAYDSEQNIRAGTQYLGWLSRRFDGDLVRILAGYNAGEGKVDRYDGIPPYRETRHYVHDVLVVYHKFKQHRRMIAATKARQQQAAQARARAAQPRRQPAPTVREASARVVSPAGNPANSAQQPAASQRVKKVYASPFKPGRAGWQANKKLAPQLYKQ